MVELAEIIGVSHTALSKIESGKNEASKKTKIALAKALGDDFGEPDLDQYLSETDAPKSKKEVVRDMSVKEFVSLKFGGKSSRRSKSEIDALTTMLDAEIKRMEEEEEKYGD